MVDPAFHMQLDPASFRDNELLRYGIYMMPCESDASAPHDHSFLEMAYVVQGCAEHTFGNQCCTIRAGDYFIVDYGEVHSYHRTGDEPLKLVNVLFLPRLIDETLVDCRSFQEVLQNYLIRFSYASLTLPPTRHIFRDDTGEIGAVLQQMLAEFQSRPAGFNEMLRSLMVRILILTMRKIRRTDLPDAHGVSAVLADYVRRNYASDLQLGAICRSLHYSPAYVSKKFHDETGIPFSVYVQTVRIEESCRLLANSHDKICRVAEAVGYSNIKYFSEIFRRHTGVSPREYRRTHQIH